MSAIEDLAGRYRIETEYEGIDSEMHRPPPETLAALLDALGVACGTEAERAASLAAAPAEPAPELRAPRDVACYLPDWLEDGRAWGVAIQLYQIRSARNWGIGDFADLATLARLFGAAGADFLGLNPLHAMFLANPDHCSPFSPSNRRLLNPLYIAVDQLADFDPATVSDQALETVRAPDLVDYAAVVDLKLAALRAHWEARHPDLEALDEFRTEGGPALARHALFEALSLHLTAEGHGPGWLSWPEPFRDPESAEVARFAETHADAVAFHVWLQFVADRQLAAARDAAMASGMRIGLYLDFAVGEAPDGSGTWSDRDTVVPGAQVGAPPDYFNAAGQNWGLAPISPAAMAVSNAAPFRALMEDATRRAGALRIDHAMGLWQLFLIPQNATPADGTYVRFPIEDMIRALAAASHANQTIVIGEDLGNVPSGFREVMDAGNILSYRILLFERHEGGFIPPEAYPRNALVCLSTHDLPTFQGWWRGDDVRLRAGYDLIGPDAAAEQSTAREAERGELLADLNAAGLVDDDTIDTDAASDALVTAVHRHLARTPSRLFAVRLEDMTGERDPVNLPSTVDEYPNWRRKLSVSLEALPDTPLLGAIAAALSAERPRSPT